MGQQKYTPRANVSAGSAPGTIEIRPHGPGRYSVPFDDSLPGFDEGFAPELHPGPVSVPDDIRTGGREPTLQTGDHGSRRESRRIARQTSDFHERHSVEEYTFGWKVRQQKVPAPSNPLWTQERAPIRPTATNSPYGYMFTRPWHIPQSTGEHLSMADHRRAYEVYGMKPQGRIGVNTYRLDPRPWDENLYVAPEAETSRGFQTLAGNRTYRKM